MNEPRTRYRGWAHAIGRWPLHLWVKQPGEAEWISHCKRMKAHSPRISARENGKCKLCLRSLPRWREAQYDG